MVVVLFGVLRFVLAMVGVVARVVIKIKIDITNGFGIWLFWDDNGEILKPEIIDKYEIIAG
jgi:hypothetical protein